MNNKLVHDLTLADYFVAYVIVCIVVTRPNFTLLLLPGSQKPGPLKAHCITLTRNIRMENVLVWSGPTYMFLTYRAVYEII